MTVVDAPGKPDIARGLGIGGTLASRVVPTSFARGLLPQSSYLSLLATDVMSRVVL